MKTAPEPEILDAVPAPDGHECALYRGEDPEPCGRDAEWLVVCEGNIDPEVDTRRNFLSCDVCMVLSDAQVREPPTTADPDQQTFYRADGGQVSDSGVTKEDIRDRPHPKRMALPCIYEEVDELIDLREARNDLTYTIKERFDYIYFVLKYRVDPRFPECPNCGSEPKIRDNGVVSCEDCVKLPPDDVVDEYWKQHNRVWGSRGHGGRARDGADRGDGVRADGGEQTESPDDDPFEDGKVWTAAKRELEEILEDYYGVEDLWLQDDALYHFDGDEEQLIAEDVPVFGHGPSGAVCVEREYLPSQETVDEVVR